ncbi:MAG: hypothetical protein R3E96_13915 [Planctomycetota bacterium]
MAQVGIDIGGTFIKFHALGPDGRGVSSTRRGPRWSHEEPTDLSRGPDSLLDQLEAIARRWKRPPAWASVPGVFEPGKRVLQFNQPAPARADPAPNSSADWVGRRAPCSWRTMRIPPPGGEFAFRP